MRRRQLAAITTLEPGSHQFSQLEEPGLLLRRQRLERLPDHGIGIGVRPTLDPAPKLLLDLRAKGDAHLDALLLAGSRNVPTTNWHPDVTPGRSAGSVATRDAARDRVRADGVPLAHPLDRLERMIYTRAKRHIRERVRAWAAPHRPPEHPPVIQGPPSPGGKEQDPGQPARVVADPRPLAPTVATGPSPHRPIPSGCQTTNPCNDGR